MHRANHVGGGAASECKHKTEMDTYVEKPFLRNCAALEARDLDRKWQSVIERVTLHRSSYQIERLYLASSMRPVFKQPIGEADLNIYASGNQEP